MSAPEVNPYRHDHNPLNADIHGGICSACEWERDAAPTPVDEEARTGAALIAAERQRQMDAEGWTVDEYSADYSEGFEAGLAQGRLECGEAHAFLSDAGLVDAGRHMSRRPWFGLLLGAVALVAAAVASSFPTPSTGRGVFSIVAVSLGIATWAWIMRAVVGERQ